jgi:hypothetical protein
MNGHFSAVGDQPANGNYDHGCQVIDEEKEFKYVLQSYASLVIGGNSEADTKSLATLAPT